MRVKLYRHVSKPGSAKAYLFQRIDKKGVACWIPKSLMSGVSQLKPPDKDGLMEVTVEVEDWFAEQNGV